MPTMTVASTPAREAPAMPGLPFLGQALSVLRDPLRFFGAVAQAHPDVAKLWLPPYTCYLLSSPEAVREVHVEKSDAYVKGESYVALRMALGNGLITSDGDHWRRQRRLAQPAFHKDRLAGFVPAMAACTDRLIRDWTDRAARGERVDVHRAMERLTLEIVGRTLFGDDITADAPAVSRALAVVVAFAHDYTNYPVHLPMSVPTPSHLRFQRAVRTLDDVVGGIIARRRARDTSTEPADLLGLLMRARDEETGEHMDDRTLRDEVVTMMLAGHETTANTLAWACHLLARNEAWADRVAGEAEARLGALGEAPPRLEDVATLRASSLAIHETLRLYPPVWIMERMPLEDQEVMGYRIPRGSLVLVCSYWLHRDGRHWEEPESFDPERFLPERAAGRHRQAYVPFAAGPRQCMGNHFALMETTLVLSMIWRRFSLRHDPDRDPELQPQITLRPKDGLPMALVPRG